ncbi:MAG: response regulator transcription factor [Eubacterium sp.]|jgi:Response regulators consisting of a CheY-like receiver domain and a winged-helix DNA-binding domain|nr:response regulator transcription factor [Eubacterium sp.]
MRVLVAEDEEDLCDIIKQKLMDDGYSVDTCYNGGDALYYMEQLEYDAVVLDVMMPVLSGFEVLEKYRAGGGMAPILFLTARDAVEDRVRGLDLGASDYVIKPFSFDELMARIRAMTRKTAAAVMNVYKAGDLSMDVAAHKVMRADREIHLSAKEFSLLEYLLRNKDKVVSREQIENSIYNYDYEGGTNVVDVYIRYLRKKIDEGYDRKLIHTVRGRGYVIREEE